MNSVFIRTTNGFVAFVLLLNSLFLPGTALVDKTGGFDQAQQWVSAQSRYLMFKTELALKQYRFDSAMSWLPTMDPKGLFSFPNRPAAAETECDKALAELENTYGKNTNQYRAFKNACTNTLGTFESFNSATVALVFSDAALMYNAEDDAAYTLLRAIYNERESPNGWLGEPLASYFEKGPYTYKDPAHDFTQKAYVPFQNGFIGFNNNESSQKYEGHGYYPEALKVSTAHEEPRLDHYIADPNDPNKSIPVYVVDITFNLTLDPKKNPWPEHIAAILHVEEKQADATWKDLSSDIPAIPINVAGEQTVSSKVPGLDPEKAYRFYWEIPRDYAGRGIDIISYAPCVRFEKETYYNIHGNAPLAETEVGCSGTFTDNTPPSLRWVEVYWNTTGQLTVLVEIMDAGGIASATLTGDPISPTTDLYLAEEYGPNIYAAIFTGLKDNQIISLTVIATDLAGNPGKLEGTVRYTQKGGRGTRCFSYTCAVGNPINPESGSKTEILPVVNLPGRGKSDIDINLTYSSIGTDYSVGIVGAGWCFPYQMNLTVYNNPLLTGVEIIYADGTVASFADQGDGTYISTSPKVYDRVEKRGENYVLITKSLTESEFNAEGQFIAQRDANGNQISLVYTGELLTRIENNAGRGLDIAYNGDGLIASINAEGKLFEFTYDGKALVGFKDANGGQYVFTYDVRPLGTLLNTDGSEYDAVEYLLTSVTTPKGHHKNEQTYDDQGRVTEQWAGEIEQRLFKYDEKNHTTTVSDAYGNATVYHYDDLGRAVKIDQPNGTSTEMAYNARFERTYLRDPKGNEWRWEFDARGNKIHETGPEGWDQTWAYDQQDKVVSYTQRISAGKTVTYTLKYDQHGNLTSLCNPENCSRTGYDAYGQPIDQWDFAGVHSTTGFNEFGDVVSITNGEGETMGFTVDEFGRVIQTTSPETRAITLEYDKNDNLTTIIGARGYRVTLTYDPNNNLIKATDPNGLETVYTYNTNEQKLSAHNPLGFTEYFGYGQMGELIRYEDVMGRVWQYDLDKMLQVIAIHGPADTLTRMTYDEVGNILTVTDPENHVTSIQYDKLYRAIQTIENDRPGAGNHSDENVTTKRTYDLLGNVLQQIDAEGNPTYFEYDLLGRLVLQRDAAGQEWHYAYDAMGNPKEITNPRGFKTTLAYDTAYRLIQTTDAKGNSFRFVYDNDGNLTDQIDPLQVVTHHAYNELNQRIQTIQNYIAGGQTTASINVATSFEYDLADNLRYITNPLGHRSEIVYDAGYRITDTYDYALGHTHMDYDPAGKALTITDDNGHSTAYAYNPLDFLTKVTNAENHSVSFTYNKMGGLLSTTDARTYQTTFEVDAFGRPTHKVDARKGEWFYTYDHMGNLLAEKDANGHTDLWTYDKVYRQLSYTDAEGNKSSYVWDKNSNLQTFVDGNTHQIKFNYDELDRLIQKINAAGDLTQYGYDPLGNQTEMIDGESMVTRYAFDPLYRLVSVVENFKSGPAPSALNDTNVTTSYAYDKAGNLIQIKDARNSITKFEYDPMGRLLRETNPLNKTWAYTYDRVGNLLTRQDAKGDLTNYEYYPDNQLKLTKYANGASVAYTYDPNNNLKTMTDRLGNTRWDYDELNQITSVSDPFNRTLKFGYDGVGNRQSLIYPDGNKVNYAYFNNDWMKSLASPAGTTSYQYDGVGNLKLIKNPNATQTTLDYDPANRVTKLINKQLTGAAKINSAFAYSYNKVGHLIKQVASYAAQELVRDNGVRVGWQKRNINTQETYSYDGLHRLVGVKHSGNDITTKTNQQPNNKKAVWDMSYLYDTVGNRIGWTTSDDLGTNIPADSFKAVFKYNAANQLVSGSYETKNRNKSYTVDYKYDPNGNRIEELTKPSSGLTEGTQYAYDVENRLVSAQKFQVGGGKGKRINRAVTRLGYDGLGRRLTQTYDPKTGSGGAKEVQYTFDGLDPVAEYDMQNQQRDDYYRGALGRISVSQHFPSGTQGQMYWYDYNFKGDVVGLSKQSGQSIHTYQYDPYGEVLPDQGNFTDPHNHYTLTGKEYDEYTGLIYFGARHYDPSSGVWMTRDTATGNLFHPSSMHKTNYVESNPVNKRDLYGFEAIDLNNIEDLSTHSEDGTLYVDMNGKSIPVYVPPYVQSGVGYDVDFSKATEWRANGSTGNFPTIQYPTYSNTYVFNDPNWETVSTDQKKDMGINTLTGVLYCVGGGQLGGCDSNLDSGLEAEIKPEYIVSPSYIPNKYGGTYRSQNIPGVENPRLNSGWQAAEGVAGWISAVPGGMKLADSDDVLYYVFIQQYRGKDPGNYVCTNDGITGNKRALLVARDRSGKVYFAGVNGAIKSGPEVTDNIRISINRYQTQLLFFTENKVNISMGGPLAGKEYDANLFDKNKDDVFPYLVNVPGYNR